MSHSVINSNTSSATEMYSSLDVIGFTLSTIATVPQGLISKVFATKGFSKN